MHAYETEDPSDRIAKRDTKRHTNADAMDLMEAAGAFRDGADQELPDDIPIE